MSSIVLGMGNDAVMFGDRDASNVPDDDLIQLVNPAAVNISAFDLSVLRGDGIFEATTVFKGFPISLENHLRRLSDSARLMDLPTPNIAAITRGIEKVMSAYDDPEPAPLLRIIVSRGLDQETGIGKAAAASGNTAPYAVNAPVAALAMPYCSAKTGMRLSARTLPSWRATEIPWLPLIRVSAFFMEPRNAKCSHGRFKRDRMRNTRSCHLPNYGRLIVSIWCTAVG